jgi:peptidoglycan DL-endopeptidase CwlO
VSGLVVGSVGVLALPAGPAIAAPAAVRAEQAVLVDLATAARAERLSGAGTQRFRREIAEAIAVAAEVDPAAVVAAWASATPTEVVVGVEALAQVGIRYRSRGTSPDEGFDCSGFTSWAWGAVGATLPRTSYDQLRLDGHPLEEARIGDLFGYPGHVMLYLGGGTYVHSPMSGRTVEVRALGRYRDHFVTPDVPAEGGRNASVMTRVRAF